MRVYLHEFLPLREPALTQSLSHPMHPIGGTPDAAGATRRVGEGARSAGEGSHPRFMVRNGRSPRTVESFPGRNRLSGRAQAVALVAAMACILADATATNAGPQTTASSRASSGARPAAADSVATGSVAKKAPQPVVLRGQVVCLAEEMHRLYGTELPTSHPHITGFRDSKGHYYTLLRTRYSEALFADPKVQAMELVLKANVLPFSEVVDVARFLGVRDGKLLDVDYFCPVCVIQEPGPGPCPCCQNPLELRIRPTDEPAP